MLLEDLGQLLEASGFGTVGTDIFLGTMPPSGPAACIALLDGSGQPSLWSHDGQGSRVSLAEITVVVRGAPGQYLEPRKVAQRVWGLLSDLPHQVLATTTLLWSHARQSPFRLPGDDCDRPLFTFACEVAFYALPEP